MATARKKSEAILEDLIPASCGVGPLLQRDYWALIQGSQFGPREIAAMVAERFPEFSPEELCVFKVVGAEGRPLEVGDLLDVSIRMAGTFQVRVLHRNPNSITLGTVEGHPEAGRITFGAYRNPEGDVIFHIRSRARSSAPHFYAGFLALGEAMQTNTWTEFVNRVALTAGTGVINGIHADTREIPDEPEDQVLGPTYLAEGD